MRGAPVATSEPHRDIHRRKKCWSNHRACVALWTSTDCRIKIDGGSGRGIAKRICPRARLDMSSDWGPCLSVSKNKCVRAAKNMLWRSCQNNSNGIIAQQNWRDSCPRESTQGELRRVGSTCVWKEKIARNRVEPWAKRGATTSLNSGGRSWREGLVKGVPVSSLG